MRYRLTVVVNGARMEDCPDGPLTSLGALRVWRDLILSCYTTRDRVWCHITPYRELIRC